MQNEIDAFRLKETIRIMADSQIPPNKAKKGQDKEGPADDFGSTEYAGLEISKAKSGEEVEIIQRCIDLRNRLKQSDLSPVDKKIALGKLKLAYRDLRDIRKGYNTSKDPVEETAAKATKVVRTVYSQFYDSGERRKVGILKIFHTGVEDPYYDGLKELYGEEGLYGYRKERMEAF